LPDRLSDDRPNSRAPDSKHVDAADLSAESPPVELVILRYSENQLVLEEPDGELVQFERSAFPFLLLFKIHSDCAAKASRNESGQPLFQQMTLVEDAVEKICSVEARPFEDEWNKAKYDFTTKASSRASVPCLRLFAMRNEFVFKGPPLGFKYVSRCEYMELLFEEYARRACTVNSFLTSLPSPHQPATSQDRQSILSNSSCLDTRYEVDRTSGLISRFYNIEGNSLFDHHKEFSNKNDTVFALECIKFVKQCLESEFWQAMGRCYDSSAYTGELAAQARVSSIFFAKEAGPGKDADENSRALARVALVYRSLAFGTDDADDAKYDTRYDLGDFSTQRHWDWAREYLREQFDREIKRNC
jgi:hypothetical protein